MNKKKFGLIIIIILFLYFIIYNQADKTAPVINTAPNIVGTEKLVPTTKENTKSNKPFSIEEKPKENNPTPYSLYIDPGLSYLTAFRQYTFFTLCADILNDIEKRRDPIESFRLKIERNKKYGYTGGHEHEQHFLEHVENCKSHLVSDDETFAKALTRLKKTYQSIEPKTAIEIELDKNLNSFEQSNGLYKQLRLARIGTSDFSSEEIDELNAQISRIQNLNRPLTTIPTSQRTPEQESIINHNNDIINTLRDKIRSSFQRDRELTQSLQAQYEENSKQLELSILNMKSPDIYVLMLYGLMADWNRYRFPENPVSEYIDVFITQSRKATVFKKEMYSMILARSALPLFACALGYPCAQNSQITLYHCIYLTNRDACASNVEDFYLNHYISTNMQADVNEFLNFLFENYAKE